MKVVQPIREIEMLQRFYTIAHAHDMKRGTGEACWELLLVIGFNTSLRVSDFRRFKVEDLRGREFAQIQAKKTGKEARILINPSARREINRLLAGRKGGEYVFQSKQKDPATGRRRPLTRQRIYQIINEIGAEAGMEERIGCHTLRKTFGYHYYHTTGNVVALQQILGHSSVEVTKRYIGVEQDEIDNSLRGLNMLVRKRASGE